MANWATLIFLTLFVYWAGLVAEGNAALTALLVFCLGAAVIFFDSLDSAE